MRYQADTCQMIGRDFSVEQHCKRENLAHCQIQIICYLVICLSFCFNYTSVLESRFVASPSERKKRERIAGK